jgi:pilus assembly protein CpaB
MARRNRSRATALAFLLVAFLAAGIFALLLVRFMRGLESQLAEAQVEEEKVDVVIAARELVQGTTLGEEDVAIMQIPATFLPDSVFHLREDAFGRVPRERILEGEFIREERLADANSGVGLNAIIPRGMRAISINITDGSAVSGFLNPGNYVDVLVTIMDDDDDRTEKTVTLLQATKVLAVDGRLGGTADSRESGSSAVKPSVTLAVTPEQAELVAHSQIEGDVTLTLRNDIDVTRVETHGATADKLIGKQIIPLSQVAPTPRPVPVQAAERDPLDDILIIRGSKTQRGDGARRAPRR